MNFGIDFGTTNTAVSYMDGHEPVPLKFGDAQQPCEYVPSVIAIKDGLCPREDYGLAAKTRIGEPGVAVYQNFKMLLGESPEVVAAHWRDADPLTPETVTSKFIAGLMRQIHDEHQLRPNRVVVTVPEVWILQNLQTKREYLIRSFKDQGIAHVEIRSEPVAAASYYLHCFKQAKGKAFAGHLLVCDCGGGTMDFCLVRVELARQDRPRITVLERAGNGMVNGHLGSAGVAFDQAVVGRLFPGLRESKPQKFYLRVRDFEQRKITHTGEISDKLKLYRQDPSLVEDDAQLFYLAEDEVVVEPKDLAAVFDEFIRPDIQKAMSELLKRIAVHRIPLDNPDRFRVLMVGGFSSFYLVREAIKAAFGHVLSTDQRFEELFSLADRALAIAKGAALIANDLTEIVETCPAHVGVTGYDFTSDGTTRAARFRILHKSTRIQDYASPIWCNQSFQIANLETPIPLFVELMDDQPIPLNVGGETLQTILPPQVTIANKIEIGFSIDENLVFSIHVRDAKNRHNVKSTTLGNLMAELPGLLAT